MSGAGPRDGGGWHPASRFADVDGVEAHYVRLGPPESAAGTVVLLHGFLVSSFAWRRNLEPLARRYDVIAPCQKGFGWSGNPPGDYGLASLGRFVLGLLDRLEVEKAHLVGNSYGGAVSLWLAAHAPERFDRLVLVNPYALPGSLASHPRAALLDAFAPLYRFAVTPTVARLGLQLLAYRGLLVDGDYLAGFGAPFERERAVHTALAVARGFDDAARELEALLPEIAHPTLVVWGTADLLLKPWAGPRLAKALPNARLVTLPGLGHCAHEEDPERFHDLAFGFLG